MTGAGPILLPTVAGYRRAEHRQRTHCEPERHGIDRPHTLGIVIASDDFDSGSVERSIPDTSCDRSSAGLLLLTWLTDFGDEFVEVPIRLIECILSFDLGAQRYLEELRSWEPEQFGTVAWSPPATRSQPSTASMRPSLIAAMNAA